MRNYPFPISGGFHTTLIAQALTSTNHSQIQIETARQLYNITRNHPETRTILGTYGMREA